MFIHKGHVRAVLDLDYSPTGEELVSAGYDKTIRIFNYETQRSREVIRVLSGLTLCQLI